MPKITYEEARALYDAAEAAGGSPMLLNAGGVWAVDFEWLPQIAAAARMPIHAGALSLAPRARSEQQPTSMVAVIPLTGVITPQGSFFDFLFGGSGGLAGFREQLAAAVANDDVTAIVLDVDSPGGLADMVPETAAAVREAREIKHVTAVVDTTMASAAYWIGSQASEVVVSPSGYAGSIGVYRVHMDVSGLNEQIGVKVTYVKAGKYKTEGNPDEPLGEAAERAWQSQVDDIYADFVGDVALGRGVSEAVVRADFGEGRMLRGDRAVTAGIADRVGTYDEVVAQLLGVAAPVLPEGGERPPADPGDGDDVQEQVPPPSVAVPSREDRLMAARFRVGAGL